VRTICSPTLNHTTKVIDRRIARALKEFSARWLVVGYRCVCASRDRVQALKAEIHRGCGRSRRAEPCSHASAACRERGQQRQKQFNDRTCHLASPVRPPGADHGRVVFSGYPQKRRQRASMITMDAPSGSEAPVASTSAGLPSVRPRLARIHVPRPSNVLTKSSSLMAAIRALSACDISATTASMAEDSVVGNLFDVLISRSP